MSPVQCNVCGTRLDDLYDLRQRIVELEGAIREHRDGVDRPGGWITGIDGDERLWSVLPDEIVT